MITRINRSNYATKRNELRLLARYTGPKWLPKQKKATHPCAILLTVPRLWAHCCSAWFGITWGWKGVAKTGQNGQRRHSYFPAPFSAAPPECRPTTHDSKWEIRRDDAKSVGTWVGLGLYEPSSSSGPSNFFPPRESYMGWEWDGWDWGHGKYAGEN